MPKESPSESDSGTPPKRRTRTRAGCGTCKIRRIKCDEAKPVCLKCRKAGLKCSYAHLRSNDPEPPNSLSRQLPPLPGTEKISQMSLDLEYFCKHVVPANHEHTSLLIYNLAPLLDRTSAEPTIVDLLSSMSIAHRAFWDVAYEPRLEVQYYETLGRALNRMTKVFPHMDGLSMSLTSTLLGIAEMTRSSSIDTSNEHYKAIADVVRTKALPFLPADDVYTSVKGGELAMAMLRECDDQTVLPEELLYQKPIPTEFLTLSEALNSLANLLMYWVSTLARRQVRWMGSIRPESILHLLDLWFRAFRPLEDLDLTASEDQLKMSLMRANHIAATLYVQTVIRERTETSPKSSPALDSRSPSLTDGSASPPSSIHYEALEEQLILDDARSYIKGVSSCAESFQHCPLGITSPLYIIACLSRDRPSRSQATALLGQANLDDGAWSTRIAWRITEIISLLEEFRSTKSGTSTNLAGSAKYQPTRAKLSSKSMPVLSGPQAPAIRPQSVACEMHSAARTVTLTLKFIERPDEENLRSISTTFSDEEDFEACRRADWPLVVPVRTFGLASGNRFPSPYLISSAALDDFKRREPRLMSSVPIDVA